MQILFLSNLKLRSLISISNFGAKTENLILFEKDFVSGFLIASNLDVVSSPGKCTAADATIASSPLPRENNNVK